MKLTMICGILTIVLIVSSAAALPSPLTCRVTQLHDGSFRYHLSRPPSSTQCRTCWEDEHRTVIARDSVYDQKLVQNLTNQSLILKSCRAYLHYTRDCKDWEEAHCKINCSLILELPTTTVNSTFCICITESWCVTQLKFGIGITVILVFVVGFFVVLRHCILKRRKESMDLTASYTRANVVINVDKEETGDVNIKAQ